MEEVPGNQVFLSLVTDGQANSCCPQALASVCQIEGLALRLDDDGVTLG